METLKVDPAMETRQRERLQALRLHRDNSRAAEILGRIESAARESGNLMPVILEGVERDLTLGEICGALRNAWGEYRPAG